MIVCSQGRCVRVPVASYPHELGYFLGSSYFLWCIERVTLCRGFHPQSCRAKGPPATDFCFSPFCFVSFSFLSCCSKEAFRQKGLLESLCPLSLFSEKSRSMDSPHSVLLLLSLLACWRSEVEGQRLEIRGWSPSEGHQQLSWSRSCSECSGVPRD